MFSHYNKTVLCVLQVFCPYPGVDPEDMAVVAFGLDVFGDVGEVAEVISVLASTVNVANFVVTNCCLEPTNEVKCNKRLLLRISW